VYWIKKRRRRDLRLRFRAMTPIRGLRDGPVSCHRMEGIPLSEPEMAGIAILMLNEQSHWACSASAIRITSLNT
jgi:hypothetical protein